MFDRMRSRFHKGLIAATLTIFSIPSLAAVFSEAPEPFPQSRLQLTKDIESSGHLVLFSPIREVRNEIRSEVMARLPVEGTGQLFEINRDANREAARDHYLKQLQARGAQVLFECEGINCGRSNVWANQVFDQPRILGRDTSQDYVVAAVADEQGRQWLTVIYTVTRGNLREYVWVEHLSVTPGASIPGFDTVNGRVRGPVIVPWRGGLTFKFEFSADDRRRLLDWAGDEGAEVVLVSFTELSEGESLDSSLKRAEQAGNSLAELLGKTGISKSQVRVMAIGPAVHSTIPNRQANRVEVVVIKRQ
ncbi:DUF4892 domain-containing protein [Marinobacter sp.]|uniref:DUF4892 domain-containing protein n=1 Tax=Marinobacter sp. TaxID=50741 RepID=UPI003564CC8D